MLQKKAFNFKCIPLKKSSPDNPKIKNESLHLETIKIFKPISFSFTKVYYPWCACGGIAFPHSSFSLNDSEAVKAVTINFYSVSNFLVEIFALNLLLLAHFSAQL